MKIVHLCLACFFPDGYSYQENLLPKFHKRIGYEVEVIASTLTFGSKGERAYMEHTVPYFNENGIKVTRLDYKHDNKFSRKFQLFQGLLQALNQANPDILFIHGCQFLDMRIVAKYLKRHPGVKVFVDNHADYSNSARNQVSKYILHRIIWKRMAKIINPYTSVFWGVLPARVNFLIENYRLPADKCKLLVMGGDDDEVNRASLLETRIRTRKRFGLLDSDFVIVTGGKIDSAKRQTLELMRAVGELGPKAKLLLFGPVSSDLDEEFNSLVKADNIRYVPWASASESYDYFSAADLVCFPGRHSVYWEQAAAMGKPMLLKEWAGTKHIDAGGNIAYLQNADRDEIASAINSLLNEPKRFADMSTVAVKASHEFLYSTIARRSIGG